MVSWPGKDHYRCHRVYCTKSKAERITKTISILPQDSPPSVTLQEAAITATEKLTESIKLHAKHFGDKQLQAIHKLADTLRYLSHKNNPNSNNIRPARQPRVQF